MASASPNTGHHQSDKFLMTKVKDKPTDTAIKPGSAKTKGDGHQRRDGDRSQGTNKDSESDGCNFDTGCDQTDKLLSVQFDDVFSEPVGVTRQESMWANACAVYTAGLHCCHAGCTNVCSVPAACFWGVFLGQASCYHTWCVLPCSRTNSIICDNACCNKCCKVASGMKDAAEVAGQVADAVDTMARF